VALRQSERQLYPATAGAGWILIIDEPVPGHAVAGRWPSQRRAQLSLFNLTTNVAVPVDPTSYPTVQIDMAANAERWPARQQMCDLVLAVYFADFSLRAFWLLQLGGR